MKSRGSEVKQSGLESQSLTQLYWIPSLIFAIFQE